MRFDPSRLLKTGLVPLLLAVPAVAVLGIAASGARPAEPSVRVLEPVAAVGMRVDTLFLGGYARGSFTEAMHLLAAEIPAGDRELVGQHLDRIFKGVLEREGLGSAGRLRVAVERTLRPDGTARAVRVLAAEAAAGGQVHTAYYFEREGRPGYYDPFGRALDDEAWAGPLSTLRVSSPYGLRRLHPILRRVLPHTGIDYAAPRGTPVRATADGVVARAGEAGGYGLLVEVRHPNGYATRYAHLSRIPAELDEGVPVTRGTVLGYVGMTGLATGPHLHYEVRRGGRPIDPALLALSTGIPADLSAAQDWAAERMRLSRLLARTPSLLRVAVAGSPGGS